MCLFFPEGASEIPEGASEFPEGARVFPEGGVPDCPEGAASECPEGAEVFLAMLSSVQSRQCSYRKGAFTSLYQLKEPAECGNPRHLR